MAMIKICLFSGLHRKGVTLSAIAVIYVIYEIDFLLEKKSVERSVEWL